MSVRTAVVAGQFYQADPAACRAQIEKMLPTKPVVGLPERIVAGVVPHAGWVFSGELAARVLAGVKQQRETVDTFVIFGAVHSVAAKRAGLLYYTGQWATPLGDVEVDVELAAEILVQNDKLLIADCVSHSREHSIEVQVPIIRYMFEGAKILPVMVPPCAQAHKVGQAVGRVLADYDKQVVCLASSDLTHYGPSYGCTPMGTGPDAIRWAKDTNDKFFIDLTLSMQADKLVESANMYHSACGAGAVAAGVAAASELGAKKGYLLGHATSAEIVASKFGQESVDSVGYAAIVFG